MPSVVQAREENISQNLGKKLVPLRRKELEDITKKETWKAEVAGSEKNFGTVAWKN